MRGAKANDRLTPPLIEPDRPFSRSDGHSYGSGGAEAGCEAVIGQRLKESGMFWTESGATNVLTLRCALKGHRWDDCWNRRNDFVNGLAPSAATVWLCG